TPTVRSPAAHEPDEPASHATTRDLSELRRDEPTGGHGPSAHDTHFGTGHTVTQLAKPADLHAAVHGKPPEPPPGGPKTEDLARELAASAAHPPSDTPDIFGRDDDLPAEEAVDYMVD